MDSYETSFSRRFLSGSYENLLLSDSSLSTEDGYAFQVHRIVLARENRYFRAMFFGMRRDRRDFLIPGIRGEMLDLILTFIYKGTVRLTDSNACELLLASDYLLVDNLTSRIKKYLRLIRIDLDNCISIYMTALKIDLDVIERRGYRYIQTHFGAIVNHETYGDISLDALKRFLDDKNLCVRSEREAWFSIVKWVEHDASSRLRYVPDLIQCLMVSDMDESLTKEIFFSDIVADNSFCKELNEMKKEEFVNGLDMFVEYRLKISATSIDLHSRRRPECLHLIVHRHDDEMDGAADGVQVFLTYDENLDLWRKIGDDTHFHPTHLIAIDYDVYMFSAFGSFIALNLIQKQWRVINMPTFRKNNHFASLRNMLFVISAGIQGYKLDVWCYNPYLHKWFEGRSVFFFAWFYSVAALQDRIFVVGVSMRSELRVWVYNVETDLWKVFPAPNVFRFQFALTAYHGKLYMIGGSNGSENQLECVEVFDLHQNKWQSIADLPYAYVHPKTVVWNDKLVVFGGEDQKPPLFWNETEAAWEVLGTFLPFKDQYLFCTIGNSEKISMILRENRDPATPFEKSPFA